MENGGNGFRFQMDFSNQHLETLGVELYMFFEKIKMKKLVALLFLLAFLASCGPHRMKCGPGRRCLVDTPKEKMIINNSIA